VSFSSTLLPHADCRDDGRTIAILPVLPPDAIETHGDRDDAVNIVNTDDGTSRLVAPPEHGDITATPVLLVMPPPVKVVVEPAGRNLPHAWA
jgi:hypothetical protein